MSGNDHLNSMAGSTELDRARADFWARWRGELPSYAEHCARYGELPHTYATKKAPLEQADALETKEWATRLAEEFDGANESGRRPPRARHAYEVAFDALGRDLPPEGSTSADRKQSTPAARSTTNIPRHPPLARPWWETDEDYSDV